jgi:prephenate dehydratase
MTERYAYLGPEGTFTEAAFRALDAAAGAQPLPCPTIQAALAAVRAGTADRAVVPIESSVEGVVTATLDDLTAGGDLQIQAELQLPIAFALLGRPGTRLADVRTVSGHPQAQPQCRRWLASRLQRRGGPPGLGGEDRRGAGGCLRRRHLRARGARPRGP